MKRTVFMACLVVMALASWGQEIIFEMEIGTPSRGLDAFIVNTAAAVEIDVFDPPPGFSETGFETGF